MSKQNWITIITIAVIAIAGAWFLTEQKPEIVQTDNPQTQEKKPEEKKNEKPSQTMENKKAWYGILKNSNDLKKGNLMLLTKDHTIYLKTSRDFSNLINQNVVVNYEGDLTNFSLGNIFLNTNP